MAVPPSFLLAGVLVLRFSASASQDIDPCDYWLGTGSDVPEPPPGRTQAPVPVKAYIDECLSNVECPASHYCSYNSGDTDPDCALGFMSCDAKTRKCVPRLGVNEVCKIGTGDCAQGLYCSTDITGKRTDPVCAPKIPKGGKCLPEATFPCVSGLVCLRKTKRCGVFTRGFEGDECTLDRHCQQERGFYCASRRWNGKCAKKGTAGAACQLAFNDYACAGFCSTHLFCMNRREIGQSCSADAQCRRYIIGKDERTDDAVCNVQSKPGVRQGVCVLESNLLRVPGQKCDPKADLCDARRSLRCEKYGGKFVCLQRFGGPCTAGSPFSFCSVNSECRRRLARTKKAPFGSDSCLRVRETVKLGDICNLEEYALCEKGTSCVEGPGIQSVRDGKHRPPIIAYCMKEVPLGGDCSRKYSTFCTDGSFCINKTCQKAAAEPAVPVEYSGFSVDCSTRPCAPGLSCMARRWGKTCGWSTVVVGLGKACSSTPTHQVSCANGTSCTRGANSKGIRRCWPARGVGALCESDSACKGRLRCRPQDYNNPLFTRICYDPSTAVPLGAKCNPANSTCASEEVPLVKCLPKGSSFSCQFESTLFRRCSAKDNFGCSTGLVCSDMQICIPAAEVRT